MKNRYTLIIFLVFSFSIISNAQITLDPNKACINCDEPDASAVLEVAATNKGVLVPRMTSTERININMPANGLLVFDISTNTFWYSTTASGWIELSQNVALDEIFDADHNTGIMTEKNTNEDVIRFDINATEKWVMTGSRIEPKNTGRSLFIGQGSGAHDDLSNNQNIALGDSTLYNNTTGHHNTATGNLSLFHNTTGYLNTAYGYQTLFSNTMGFENSAIGYQALKSNLTGYYNTANGYRAMYSNTSGFENTAIGMEALFDNKYGDYNSTIGYQSLYHNTSGSFNVANGFQALRSNTLGNNNTAIGADAMFNNTVGMQNSANGFKALFSNITGNQNTAVGYYALHGNTTGNDRTAIGFSANSLPGPFDNSTGLGNNADCTAANQVRIGNNAVSSIGGAVGWTIISDQRFKKNVKENVKGLEFINALRPVTYTIDQNAVEGFYRKHYGERDPSTWHNKYNIPNFSRTGFLAQEVEAAADNLGFDFSGVDKPKNEKDYYGLRYSEFTVPLVKAVQELSARNKDWNEKVTILQSENEALKLKLISISDEIDELKNLKSELAEMKRIISERLNISEE